MLGDFLREAAVLVLVFGFLDTFLRGRAPTLGYIGAVVGVSAFAMLSGIIAERTRK